MVWPVPEMSGHCHFQALPGWCDVRVRCRIYRRSWLKTVQLKIFGVSAGDGERQLQSLELHRNQYKNIQTIFKNKDTNNGNNGNGINDKVEDPNDRTVSP